VTAVDWLRARDRGFAALRRSARTAVVMPVAFAIGDRVIANADVATFAAFGSFAQLLLVDFPGPLRDRLRAQLALAITGGVFICVATLASQSTWTAVIAMALVGFGVLFAGVVSSVLAGATTSLLLVFILPVSLPGSVASIPDRLAGWGIASAGALIAVALLWPAPARDPVRDAATAAIRALAARLRAGHAASAAADAAVETLHATFFATPYRPTGLSTAARAVVRLVDELRWLDAIVVEQASDENVDARAGDVRSAAATVLERSADLLDRPGESPAVLRAAVGRLQDAAVELEGSAMRMTAGSDVVSALDPGFRAQELSFIVAQIASNVDLAAAAERRSWVGRLLGRAPRGLPSGRAAAQERAGSHSERHSLWLRNSIRGAAGLGLAVLVAELTGAQHAFWVVLGALAVLRSNALSTGQNAILALVGTAAGFAVGGLLVALVGTNTAVLWALLPFAILLAGLAPAAISFTAGQAAFTLTLLILFNIIAPAGWEIGLVRIEDVALGSAVSLAVGLLFWPRGAASVLGTALAEAYRDTASYLVEAVRYGVSRCDRVVPAVQAPTAAAMRAAASARRLDDAFRGYLAERGGKPIALGDATSLVTGIVPLRLAADAVLDLWQRQADGTDGDRSAARRELLERAGVVTEWYRDFAAGLSGRGDVPEPLGPDGLADRRLVETVDRDLRRDDGSTTATAVRIIWTGDHLDAARRLQSSLVEPARSGELE
jgi:uncharacterized membrane protein YccC